MTRSKYFNTAAWVALAVFLVLAVAVLVVRSEEASPDRTACGDFSRWLRDQVGTGLIDAAVAARPQDNRLYLDLAALQADLRGGNQFAVTLDINAVTADCASYP